MYRFVKRPSRLAVSWFFGIMCEMVRKMLYEITPYHYL